MVLILDFEKLNMTEEEYIDQYISAEIPELPNPGDKSKIAQKKRERHHRVTNLLIHTCLKDRCKEKETDPCNKHFPVSFSCVLLCFHYYSCKLFRNPTPYPTLCTRTTTRCIAEDKRQQKANRETPKSTGTTTK